MWGYVRVPESTGPAKKAAEGCSGQREQNLVQIMFRPSTSNAVSFQPCCLTWVHKSTWTCNDQGSKDFLQPNQVSYHQPADSRMVVVSGKAHSAPAAQGTPLPLVHKTPGKQHGSEQTTVGRIKLKITAFTVNCNALYFTWRQVSWARKLFP